MKLKFLASTRSDLDWFRKYYDAMFRDGARNAREQTQRTLSNLRANPRIGRPIGDGNRELSIVRTPFILVYRIDGDMIEILRLRDGRGGTLDLSKTSQD